MGSKPGFHLSYCLINFIYLCFVFLFKGNSRNNNLFKFLYAIKRGKCSHKRFMATFVSLQLQQTKSSLRQQMWNAPEAELHPGWFTAPALLETDDLCGERVYPLPTNTLHLFVPSWLWKWPKTRPKYPKDNWISSHKLVQEFIQFLIYSRCHLVNCYFLAATWPLYRSWPSCQNPCWIQHAPVIHTQNVSPLCSRVWMDGIHSLHYMICLKIQRTDAQADWLNDGWCPQPLCLPPVRRHLCRWGLQQSKFFFA